MDEAAFRCHHCVNVPVHRYMLAGVTGLGNLGRHIADVVVYDLERIKRKADLDGRPCKMYDKGEDLYTVNWRIKPGQIHTKGGIVYMATHGQLTVWGVRGSFPVADRTFLDYGGNTSCLSLDLAGGTVILDAGSGLDRLGEALFHRRVKRVDLLLSHVHLDHVMGLAAFRLLHEAGTEVHIYGEARGSASLRSQLETLVGPPYWPLGLSDVRADVFFHETGPGDRFPLAGAVVTTLRGCHPNGSLLYRLDIGGRSLVYALDCEMAGDMFEHLADFAKQASLIIWDSSFAPDELRPGWGHSTWELGTALRRAAGAEQILMTHFDRSYPDSSLQRLERLARQADSACRFAKEGMVIEL